MINFIKDKEIRDEWGYYYVSVFFFANLFSLVLRA